MIIKSVILGCILFLQPNIVFGQNIFQKRDSLPYRNSEFVSVFPSDTGFFTLGWAIPVFPFDTSLVVQGGRRLTMAWYDWDGDLIKHKYIRKDSTEYFSMWYDNDNTIYNNGFYHFGAIDDSSTLNPPNTLDAYAAKITFDGDTVWTKRIDYGYFDTGSAGIIASNGDFIGVGYSQLPNEFVQSRAIRFDSLGNIKWNKTYNTAFENRTRHIIKDQEDNFYISGYRRQTGGGSNPMSARAMIFKIDSAGVLQWTKIMPAICDEYSSAIDLANDGNILVATTRCTSQQSIASVESHIKLCKLSKSNGDTLWCKDFPSQYSSAGDYPNFIQNIGDDIILGGSGFKLFYDVNGQVEFGKYVGVLIRTDSVGNVKWQRYYTYNEEDAENIVRSYLTDGKQTQDGGFILVGRTTHESNFDDGWIIKTDENGCIDLSCVNGIQELEDDDFKLLIYPNPADSYVTVKLPVTYSTATLQFMDMHGKIVKSVVLLGSDSQTIETNELPSGLYQLLITSKNKVLGRNKLLVMRYNEHP